MKINTGAFGSKLPNKIAISNTAPNGVLTLQEIVETLGPGHELLLLLIPAKWLWKDYKAGKINWAEYKIAYRAQIRFVDLWTIMKVLCKHLGTAEITLCCYEAEKDEHCHRKLLFDWLPDDIQGERK
jgi:uncharacterized protein YeaO (DUF488 family)